MGFKTLFVRARADIGDYFKRLNSSLASIRIGKSMRDHGVDGGPRVIDYAWGFGARNETDLESDGGIHLSTTLDSRYAAYCVRWGIMPSDLSHFRNAPGI